MTSRRRKKPLTDLRGRFVREYLKDLNATQAAIRAGFSVRSAKQMGCRVMGDPEVRRAIEQALDRAAEAADLSAAQVLNDIKRLASKAERAGDLGPAMRGRELLGKHLKLFSEKHIVDVGPSLADIIAQSFKKPEGQ